ncbi:MAG: very short patch repair endonuclease [Gammaproteobacteria bacterium]|nr:very short patch repair endonuclease [Gammaproteobacteria bacterium]
MPQSPKVVPTQRRDPLTPKQRSSAMRRVRRTNTSPELALRRELTRRGLRYRVDYPRAPGRPDIAMVGRRIAVFVDGEFWHGKKLSAARLAEMPEYWRKKIEGNVARDLRVNGELCDLGWTVIRITDRVIGRDLHGVAEFVERAAHRQAIVPVPDGVDVCQPAS